MTDDNDTNIDRRTFLKRSGIGAFGTGGLAAKAFQDGGQDGDEENGGGGDGNGPGASGVYSRRFVFPYPEALGPQQEPGERYDPEGDLLQKIILVTDRKDVYPDELDIKEDDVINCISGWSEAELSEWEAIIVDWKNTVQIFGSFTATPTVQAKQLVEISSLIARPRPNPIPLGTPFIITGVQTCQGDFVGVTAEKIPGVQIATGPGESTGEMG